MDDTLSTIMRSRSLALIAEWSWRRKKISSGSRALQLTSASPIGTRVASSSPIESWIRRFAVTMQVGSSTGIQRNN